MFLVLILSIFSFVYTTDIQTSCNTQFVTEKLLKSTFDVRTILCDIDGTLLANHKFSDVSFNAIKETIQVKGYPFFPCTGRTRSSAVSALGDKFLELFGDSIDKLGGVYQQGLTVYDSSGKLIFEQTLNDEIISKVIFFCEKHNISVIAYAGEDIYCKKQTERTAKIVEYSDPLPIEVPEGLSHLKSQGIFIQKMILLDDELDLQAIRPVIEEEFGNEISLTKAVPGMLEVLPKGSNKGFGVMKLLEHENIDPLYTMAFGDGENDIEMLQYINYGVAMENGNAKLKSIAKYITSRAEDNGVARVLNMLPIRQTNN